MHAASIHQPMYTNCNIIAIFCLILSLLGIITNASRAPRSTAEKEKDIQALSLSAASLPSDLSESLLTFITTNDFSGRDEIYAIFATLEDNVRSDRRTEPGVEIDSIAYFIRHGSTELYMFMRKVLGKRLAAIGTDGKASSTSQSPGRTPAVAAASVSTAPRLSSLSAEPSLFADSDLAPPSTDRKERKERKEGKERRSDGEQTYTVAAASKILSLEECKLFRIGKKRELCGIVNLGATCYINAVVNLFRGIRPVRDVSIQNFYRLY